MVSITFVRIVGSLSLTVRYAKDLEKKKYKEVLELLLIQAIQVLFTRQKWFKMTTVMNLKLNSDKPDIKLVFRCELIDTDNTRRY